MKHYRRILIYLSISVPTYAFCFSCIAQQDKNFLQTIDLIENNKGTSPKEKLIDYYNVKKKLETAQSISDSVYAELLDKIGYTEVLTFQNYKAGIQYLNQAIKINSTSKRGSEYFLVANYIHLAYTLEIIGLLENAAFAYDSTIVYAIKFPDLSFRVIYARLAKANIFFDNGDYEKSVEECMNDINYSLAKKDSSLLFEILNKKAEALSYENKLAESLAVLKTILTADKMLDKYNYATALKTEARNFEIEKKFQIAENLFSQAIQARIQSGNNTQIAKDYIAFGNFYLDSLHNYINAKACYLKAIEYASKDKNKVTIASTAIDLGEVFFQQKKFNDAEKYYDQAFRLLKINIDKNDLISPLAQDLNSISFKELIIVLMNDKTELLLKQYEANHFSTYLFACLKAAQVTDSVITQTRHEQIGEESKLFWRNNTRDFFENAIEASYLAKNDSMAFYFMEKSRAVLLNDKLNELGAAAYLPKNEIAKEENLHANIIQQEQSLAALPENSPAYNAQQIKWLKTKDEFEDYTKSLEQKYPVYYQYKYADKVPSLKELQNYLGKHNQSLIYYFMNDSVAYALAISKTNTKFIKLSSKEFNSKKLSEFLQLCSDKETLNNNYDSFAKTSNQLYQLLFQPLNIEKGRVIICPDNFLIPFEAICTDKNGSQFLLNDFAFSYVYSVRYLIKTISNSNPKENFLGFAPVTFNESLKLPSLLHGDDALQKCAAHYNSSKLLLHEDASQKNFMHFVSDFSVVNVFSHAHADSSNEPLLYMQDAVIHLSDLQLLTNPATQLVVLSACQTSVGKNATGEGIYSLARGFAAAGIPCVAATLWKADDQTIYAISEKFHEYLSEGMPKDVALQKAKLYFIQNNSSDKMLPYYWANMVLAGNAEPLKLSAAKESFWWIIVACVILAAITFFMLRKRRKNFSGIF